jgi:hypothetical protein
MTREEKIKQAIKSGAVYNPISGDVVGANGKPFTKKINGYIVVSVFKNGKRGEVYAHQFAWYVTHGEIVNLLDHKNRIKTDNRIVNLRKTTKQINVLNNGSKGAYLDKRSGKWISYLSIGGRRKQYGTFLLESDAITRTAEIKKTVIEQLIQKENGSIR